MPVAFDASRRAAVGYSNVYPGGYGELMVLSDLLAPQGAERPVGHGRAALTEPMAVGRHAVEQVAGDAGARGHRARLRARRPRRDRRPAPEGRRAHHRRRLLAQASAAGRDHGRPRGGRPQRRAGHRRLASPASAPRARWSSSRPSGCPACSTPPCATPPAAPRSSSSACACRPTASSP